MYENDTAITRRDQEINDIVKSIHGLAEIFRDMQSLVVDQGTILDRIDYNVEQAAVSIKEANKELIKVCFSFYRDLSLPLPSHSLLVGGGLSEEGSIQVLYHGAGSADRDPVYHFVAEAKKEVDCRIFFEPASTISYISTHF